MAAVALTVSLSVIGVIVALLTIVGIAIGVYCCLRMRARDRRILKGNGRNGANGKVYPTWNGPNAPPRVSIAPRPPMNPKVTAVPGSYRPAVAPVAPVAPAVAPVEVAPVAPVEPLAPVVDVPTAVVEQTQEGGTIETPSQISAQNPEKVSSNQGQPEDNNQANGQPVVESKNQLPAEGEEQDKAAGQPASPEKINPE